MASKKRRTVSKEPALRIGAVSRLVGLSVHTIRKWEDRYRAVVPRRTEAGGRLYTREDLRRLGLIKRLSEAGMALGDVAGLPLKRLEALHAKLPASAMDDARGAALSAVRCGVIGDALPVVLEHEAQRVRRLDLQAFAPTGEELLERLGGKEVAVLIVEVALLDATLRDELDTLTAKTGARGVVLVYGFGARNVADALRGTNVALMRAPVDVAELERIALALVQDMDTGPVKMPEPSIDGFDEPAPRRFSRQAIASVSTTLPRIRCECPHHLSDLILGLLAFEDYSAHCESLNPEDAALHRFLGTSTSRARVILEQMLARVAEAEGIDLTTFEGETVASV